MAHQGKALQRLEKAQRAAQQAETAHKSKGRVVRVGFGSPRIVRGYHPSGVQEVLVHNPSMLDSVDGSTQAVRIAGGVGRKKRLEIQRRAAELGIRVLNPVEEPVEGEAGEDND